MSLVVSHTTSRGISAPIPYIRSTNSNTLTLDGSFTSLMVLHGNQTPLTSGMTQVTDHQVTIPTATTVNHVL